MEEVACPPSQIRATQQSLLNAVSASLIKEPKFAEEGSRGGNQILSLAVQVAHHNPEFILKLALYVRDDLNIRTTANFLLAIASILPACRPYLKLYLPATVRLPSDWLEVAKLVKGIPGRTRQGLPSALRAALILKFPDFQEFQLAKYNKDKSIAKRNKRDRERAQEFAAGTSSESESEGHPLETLKQMVRNLHINQPVYNVMCLTGKRYPATAEEFTASGLEGEFDPERAGKRMKLKVPLTWETELSAKGNHAHVWENLIEERKLPFMAMLRNLRNLLETGVSRKYHDAIIAKLKDEHAIANSRQFPFRFFSAYEAIKLDFGGMRAGKDGRLGFPKREGQAGAPGKGGAGRGRGRGDKPPKVTVPAEMPTPALIEEYRLALDTAVRIATSHNIKPIHGSTMVLVKADLDYGVSGSGKGASVRTMLEVALLLGLMFKYSCEVCILCIYSEERGGFFRADQNLSDGTILQNMAILMEKIRRDSVKRECPKNTHEWKFPFPLLHQLTKDRIKVDNLIVISDDPVGPGGKDMERYNLSGTGGVSDFLKKFRYFVNPDLLYVSVNVKGDLEVESLDEDAHPNNVALTGFSDSILRFVGERGESQLDYIERIKEVKGLKGLAGPANINLPTENPVGDFSDPTDVEEEWPTLKFFISSTFADMHGERDALVKEVFPALRRRCMQNQIKCNLVEVDFRWGITANEAQSGQSLSLCLNAVENSTHVFIGLLGERYGFRCNDYNIEDDHLECFEWLKSYPTGRSVTELEIMQALQEDDCKPTLFYFRDPRFSTTIPSYDTKAKAAFEAENDEVVELMANLKSDIMNLAPQVHTYACRYGGVVDGQPSAGFLKSFIHRVTEDLWKVIQDKCPPTPPVSLSAQMTAPHRQAMRLHTQGFSGRIEVLNYLKRFLTGSLMIDDSKRKDILGLVGEEGLGKSAIMSQLVKDLSKWTGSYVSYHFLGCSQESATGSNILYSLTHAIVERFGLEVEIPAGYPELCQTFPAVLKEGAALGRILILLDNLDALTLDQLPVLAKLAPQTLPDNCKVLFSCTPSCPAWKTLMQKPVPPSIYTLLPLEIPEREALVSEVLNVWNKRLEGQTPPDGKGKAKESPFSTQLKALVGKSGAGKPLYLRCAIEHLRIVGQFERLLDQICKLPSTLPQLMDCIFKEIETRLDVSVTSKLMCLIAVSSGLNGIDESDLIETSKLSTHTVSRFLQTMNNLLHQNGTGVDFLHPLIRQCVQKRYMKTAIQASILHDSLYKHNRVRGSENGWDQSTPARLRAIMYHGVMGKVPAIVDDLTDIRFMEACCASGCIFLLMDAYVKASAINSTLKKRLGEFHDLVLGNLQGLMKAPTMVYQIAANLPNNSIAHKASTGMDAHVSWLKWLNKEDTKDLCTQRFKASARKITCCTFSHDGTLFACGGADWVVSVYEIATGKQKLTLQGHTGSVTGCSFDRNNHLVATTSKDGTARVWSTSDGSTLHVLQGHTKPVNACAFGVVEDKNLVTASDDFTLRIWSIKEEKPMLRVLKGHTRPVTGVRVHVKGKLFVSGSWDQTCRVWENLNKSATLLAVIDMGMSLRDVAIAPTMVQTVAGCSINGSVKLFDVTSQHNICHVNSPKEAGRMMLDPTNSISYSPDAELIAACSGSGSMKVFRAGTTGEMVVNRVAHYEGVNAVEFAPSGTSIASVSSDCDARIWKQPNAKDLVDSALHGEECTGVAFSSDGHFLATSSWDCRVKVVDMTSNPPSVRFTMVSNSPVRSVCVSSDDQFIISGNNRGSIQVWRLSGGLGGSENSGSEYCSSRFNESHNGPVTGVANRGNVIVSVGYDQRINTFAIKEGKLKRTHAQRVSDAREITSVAMTHDDWIVTTGLDSHVMFHRINEDGKIVVHSSFSLKHWGLSVVPCGEDVLYIDAGGRVGMCGLMMAYSDDTAIRAAEDGVHATSITSTPEKFVIVGYSDRSVRLYELREGEEIELQERCRYYTKAPCTALAWYPGRLQGTSILAAVDRLGNLTLLRLFLVHKKSAPLEAKSVPPPEVCFEELEGNAAVQDVKPKAQRSRRAPAQYTKQQNGLPFFHYKGHPNMDSRQTAQQMLTSLQAFGFIQ